MMYFNFLFVGPTSLTFECCPVPPTYLCFLFMWSWLISSARNFFNSFREDHEMMHARDLQKLEGVLSPSHLEVGYCLKFCITSQFLDVAGSLALNNS